MARLAGSELSAMSLWHAEMLARKTHETVWIGELVKNDVHIVHQAVRPTSLSKALAAPARCHGRRALWGTRSSPVSTRAPESSCWPFRPDALPASHSSTRRDCARCWRQRGCVATRSRPTRRRLATPGSLRPSPTGPVVSLGRSGSSALPSDSYPTSRTSAMPKRYSPPLGRCHRTPNGWALGTRPQLARHFRRRRGRSRQRPTRRHPLDRDADAQDSSLAESCSDLPNQIRLAGRRSRRDRAETLTAKWLGTGGSTRFSAPDLLTRALNKVDTLTKCCSEEPNIFS